MRIRYRAGVNRDLGQRADKHSVQQDSLQLRMLDDAAGKCWRRDVRRRLKNFVAEAAFRAREAGSRKLAKGRVHNQPLR